MSEQIRSLPAKYHSNKKFKAKIRQKILRQQLPKFNAFASHIPILIGLSILVKPKRILELGPGLFSTPLFIDKQYFPDVTNITCLESEQEWFDTVKKNFVGMDIVDLIFAAPKVSEYISKLDKKFDLIFVDDSLETEDRCNTIKEVSKIKDLKNTVVVIHDFEVPEYQQASAGFKNRYRFQCFTPNVGVVFNDDVLTYEQLENLEMKIYQERWKSSVTTFGPWLNKLK